MQEKFNFYHEDNLSLLYTATLKGDEYIVSWEDVLGADKTEYPVSVVKNLISSGDWLVVSADNTTEIDSEDIKDKLYERIIKFMKDNNVSCVETIHQCDWVILNAYDFMSDLYEIVESELPSIEE